MTLDEILTALRTHVTESADSAKDIAAKLHADSTLQPVAQALIDKGAGKGKAEITTKLRDAERQRDEALRERDELREEFDGFKAKTPDAAELEKRVTAKYEPKVAAAKQDAALARATLATTLKRLAVQDFVRALKPGAEVDEEYASAVLAAKYDDRFVVGEDGAVRVLQPGKPDAYEPAEGQSAAALLAADVRKTVPPKFLISHAEGGAGITTGAGAGGLGQGKTKQQLKAEALASGLYT